MELKYISEKRKNVKIGILSLENEIEVVPLSKIPQFRIIGSKYNMLWNLLKIIKENYIKGEVFFDVFSGSAVVGRFFKKMYAILSNDNLFFSFILQRALVVLNKYPTFDGLKFLFLSSLTPQTKIRKVLDYLNMLDNREEFIFCHYTPESKKVDGIERRYFTKENGRKIDSIRLKIQEWFENGNINEDEYFYLIALLLLAVQKVANISGTYGAFNKFWDPRAHKKLTLKPIEVIESNFCHKAFCEDSFDLINKINCDIAYIDPPYNERQYITNYHLLETIAKYDNPKIHGKTGLRNYTASEKSDFCSKKTADKALIRLLEGLKTKWVILSYNSEGLLNKNKIIEIFDKTGKFSPVKFYQFPYRRFKSNHITPKKHIKEYVFVAKVIK